MRTHCFARALLVGAVLLLTGQARADDSFAAVAAEVNQKLVKLFGSGGFRGLAAYGTGIVITDDGYVLTVANHLLDTQDLRVHLHDGRRYPAKVIVVEPELDVALVKIDAKGLDGMPHFDIAEAAKRPAAEAGTAVLAFSNQFEIATRDEPMSVQRGVIAAFSKLHGRKGIHEIPYRGEVYFVDAITNNPGAAGGVLTTRRGELLGLVGKELRNTLSDTWVNYAIPIQSKLDVRTGEKTQSISIVEIVEKKDQYKPIVKEKGSEGPGGYHGIILVPNVVERTPPYVEDVIPGSPAAKIGLKPDDLIVYVDGEQVVSIKAFRDIVDKTPPGTAIRLEIRRGDRLVGFDLKLEQPLAKKKP